LPLLVLSLCRFASREQNGEASNEKTIKRESIKPSGLLANQTHFGLDFGHSEILKNAL
jgi:hypothetical protein